MPAVQASGWPSSSLPFRSIRWNGKITGPSVTSEGILPIASIFLQNLAVRQASSLTWRASAKSLLVSPPSEWVLRMSVTLFHAMTMSG